MKDKLVIVVGPERDSLVLALVGTVGALEVITRRDLARGTLDRIIDLGHIGAGDDIEGRHGGYSW